VAERRSSRRRSRAKSEEPLREQQDASAKVPRRSATFPLGIDYYPLDRERQSFDDWYDGDVEADFAAFAEARLTLVRVFISWKYFEQQVGNYDDEAAQRLDRIMAAARESNLQIIVCFFADDRLAELVDVTWGKKRDPRTDAYLIQREVSLVQRIVMLHRAEKAVFAWDLANEAFLSGFKDAKTLDAWVAVMRDAIREVDPDTPILVEAAQMANPSGFPTFRPLRGTNLIYGVHYYYPHGFTHQRINGAKEFGSPEASPFKLYPGWVPVINWTDEGWFGQPYEWWDRWELAGSALPVYEFLIRYRRPLDMGEFGVVGYAFDGVGPCATGWTSDAIALAERWGASWDLWGYSTGFGWYGGVPDLVTDAWERAKARGR
jgi:hypothetical protein